MASKRAKLFTNGGSQAVRLPRALRFPEGLSEVFARKVGNSVILEPIGEWPETFRKTLGAWDEPVARPAQPSYRDPFKK